MSQHGETSTSSTMCQTQETRSGQEETYGLQNEVISNCIKIGQQFRAGEISKLKASMLLFQAIPQGQLKESAFITAYGAYMNGLSLGKHLMPPCSYSITGDLNFSCMEENPR